MYSNKAMKFIKSNVFVLASCKNLNSKEFFNFDYLNDLNPSLG